MKLSKKLQEYLAAPIAPELLGAPLISVSYLDFEWEDADYDILLDLLHRHRSERSDYQEVRDYYLQLRVQGHSMVLSEFFGSGGRFFSTFRDRLTKKLSVKKGEYSMACDDLRAAFPCLDLYLEVKEFNNFARKVARSRKVLDEAAKRFPEPMLVSNALKSCQKIKLSDPEW